MAGLAGERGSVHPWWQAGAALLAVLDSGNTEAIRVAEQAYMSRKRDG